MGVGTLVCRLECVVRHLLFLRGGVSIWIVAILTNIPIGYCHLVPPQLLCSSDSMSGFTSSGPLSLKTCRTLKNLAAHHKPPRSCPSLWKTSRPPKHLAAQCHALSAPLR